MIRNALTSLPRACARPVLAAALAAGFATGLGAGFAAPAAAQTTPAQKPAQKPAAGAAAQKPQSAARQAAPKHEPAAAAAAAEPGKPTLVATIGDWGVYVTSGGGKQCYALSQPKDRLPKDLKREPAYLFISSRPSEKVRNEVSIINGFDVKADEKTRPELSVGAQKFQLAAQKSHLWIKDADNLNTVVDALRKGSKLTVKAASLRGNVTTDSYSLTGIGGALDRVQKECP